MKEKAKANAAANQTAAHKEAAANQADAHI